MAKALLLLLVGASANCDEYICHSTNKSICETCCSDTQPWTRVLYNASSKSETYWDACSRGCDVEDPWRPGAACPDPPVNWTNMCFFESRSGVCSLARARGRDSRYGAHRSYLGGQCALRCEPGAPSACPAGAVCANSTAEERGVLPGGKWVPVAVGVCLWPRAHPWAPGGFF